MRRFLLALSVLTVFVLTIGIVTPQFIMGQTNIVATYSQAQLILQTYGDEVKFRSGVQGNWMYDHQQYDGHQPSGRVTGAYGDYRVTQRLQLLENVPNALGLSPDAPVTFTFPEGLASEEGRSVGMFNKCPYGARLTQTYEEREESQQ